MTDANAARATLVVVDDDDSGRRMLRRALERKGYAVLEASNGRAGLDLIRERLPDAALLDLRMPGELSGFDVARMLRDDPELSAMPTVVVSASVQTDAHTLARELGVAGFVEKPVDFAELYATLDRLLPHAARG
jgi:CheY-like chemotaxis protein